MTHSAPTLTPAVRSNAATRLQPRPKIPLAIGPATLLLTPQQHALFVHMLERPGRIFTKRELLTAIKSTATPKLVDIVIHRLSRFLADAFPDPASPPPIQFNNIWGLGHSLTYGPPTAPTSGVRWTPSAKEEFLHTVRFLEAMIRETPHDSRLLEPRQRQLAVYRADHPEITDEMIADWHVFGIPVNKNMRFPAPPTPSAAPTIQ